MHIVQQTNKYKWWLYALFISVSSYHRTIYISGLQSVRVCTDPGQVVGNAGVDCGAGGGTVLETPGSGTNQFPYTVDVTDQWAARVSLQQGIKKQCEKTQFLTSFKKGIKEYTFVSALNIKSAKNKTFIDIWGFFHYNDHLVISYVAGAVAAGVDTDVGSLLKVQETGQSQGAATVTVADDGGLGLLEDVGETSTLQYIASKD